MDMFIDVVFCSTTNHLRMLMDFNIALLQSDFEGKLKTQESAVLGKITKIRGEESSTTRIL